MSYLPNRRVAALFGVATVLMLAGLSLAQSRQQPEGAGIGIAGDILRLDCVVEPTEPSRLVVTATAIVGVVCKKPRLVRAAYETPPDDGIQDYFLLADYASQASNGSTNETELTVKHTWDSFRKSAPWLKGVRVHSSRNRMRVLVPRAQ